MIRVQQQKKRLFATLWLSEGERWRVRPLCTCDAGDATLTAQKHEGIRHNQVLQRPVAKQEGPYCDLGLWLVERSEELAALKAWLEAEKEKQKKE